MYVVSQALLTVTNTVQQLKFFELANLISYSKQKQEYLIDSQDKTL